MGSFDDSTGKGKYAESFNKNQALSAVFMAAMCVGLIISERLYLSTNGEDILRGTALPNKAQQGRSPGVAALIAKNPRMKELEAYLQIIAPTREVMIGVSNMNPLREGMLTTFLEGIHQANVSNYLIVALDEETTDALKEKNINVFYMPVEIPKSQADTGSNHAVSAMKFGIIKKFLMLGWAVLLSDIDICVLQDPFKHLYRDSDVEGMSDGYDPHTAYGAIDGFDDPSMGWARFAQKELHFNMNSGLFYLKANDRTIELMQRLETRLNREKYWDQTAYNEEIFFLSHDDYRSPQVTVRVMSIYKFMNSKVLFKDVRNRPASNQPPMPVMVHINYHPDKHERMKAVFKYYLEGKKEDLMRFPGGSEPGT